MNNETYLNGDQIRKILGMGNSGDDPNSHSLRKRRLFGKTPEQYRDELLETQGKLDGTIPYHWDAFDENETTLTARLNELQKANDGKSWDDPTSYIQRYNKPAQVGHVNDKETGMAAALRTTRPAFASKYAPMEERKKRVQQQAIDYRKRKGFRY